MANENQQWEYRVQTLGGFFGTKDELLQSTLDEWGVEGWEVISVYAHHGSEHVTAVAKRALMERARRARSMPQMRDGS
jgi:hypothetical protein